jgi:hypothetical protein
VPSEDVENLRNTSDRLDVETSEVARRAGNAMSGN